MNDSWFVVKDGNYFTRGSKFTDNINLAYLYKDKKEAEFIAQQMGGEVIANKKKIWVVVKDGKYLSLKGKYVENLKDSYSFNKDTAEQYARELHGEAVQVLI